MTNKIEHMSSNGTVFKSDSKDLSSGVNVYSSWVVRPCQMAADFAEFGAWHRSVIWEDLEGFAGYDCVNYVYCGKR